MALNAEATWISSFETGCPPVGAVVDGVNNFADTIDGEASNLLSFASPVVLPVTYTWGKAAFVAALSSAVPTGSASTAFSLLASAWEAGVNAGTMVATGTGYVGTSTPSTTWSSPPTITIVSASVTTAKSNLQAALEAAPLVDDPANSEVPGAFRQAFLELQFTVTGPDSTPPPTGPLVLTTTASTE